MKNRDASSLAGKLLLAMPNMGDPRFHRAVIVVCAHDENGAMGLVINHVLPGIDLRNLFEQLNIAAAQPGVPPAPLPDIQVLSGGPVENGRGFLLHSKDFHLPDTVEVTDHLSVTGTIDALRAVAEGRGPKTMLFVLGYAGWTPGQLDREIQQNVWLVAEATPALVFTTTTDDKWAEAIKILGIDPGMLSANAGRA